MFVAAHAIVAVVVVRCVLFVSAVVVFAAVVAVLAVVVCCRWFARIAVPSLPCLSLECLDLVPVSLLLLLPLLLLLLLLYYWCRLLL